MTLESIIKVLIVDDHQIFLDSLKVLLDLQTGIEVVDMATNTDEALSILKTTDIDVVVTDINMPGQDGIELIKRAQTIRADVKLIALSMLSDSSTIHDVIDAGAHGYLLKNSSGKELSQAIQLVSTGQVYISSEINVMLSRQARNKGSISELTAREKEVLTLIISGLSSKQMAEKLHLSVDTIKYHRKHILSKFNQPNTAAMVKFAIDHKLV